MSELVGGQIVGERYSVVAELGRGGMAAVYEVTHLQLRTRLALKVLTTRRADVRERLLLEGRAMAAAPHPNVVQVIDVVDVDGAPGLLLELVRGPSLDRFLAGRKLTWEQCDLLADGIFAGLGAAHAAGLVHRDLKPANILCAVSGDRMTPKIADFGLAKVLGDTLGAAARTRTGDTLGTPAYTAPEQIGNAANVDHRADLFSLGTVLYELCCGVRAFDADDLLALYVAIGEGRFTPPRERAPDLPARMERAILACLELDRERRPGSVAQVAALWRDGTQNQVWSHVPEKFAVRDSATELTTGSRETVLDSQLSLEPPLVEATSLTPASVGRPASAVPSDAGLRVAVSVLAILGLVSVAVGGVSLLLLALVGALSFG